MTESQKNRLKYLEDFIKTRTNEYKVVDNTIIYSANEKEMLQFYCKVIIHPARTQFMLIQEYYDTEDGNSGNTYIFSKQISTEDGRSLQIFKSLIAAVQRVKILYTINK